VLLEVKIGIVFVVPVKAFCLLLNVFQSVELNLPLFVALANGMFKVKEPLDVIGLPVTLTSVPK
jgi:hypothetical protein